MNVDQFLEASAEQANDYFAYVPQGATILAPYKDPTNVEGMQTLSQSLRKEGHLQEVDRWQRLEDNLRKFIEYDRQHRRRKK